MKRHICNFFFLSMAILPACFGVTSVITKHNSSADFLKGQTDKIVVDSAGTLRLAPETITVDCGSLLSDAWSIHTMYLDREGVLYLGTGPNAKVIRYLNGKAEQVYPLVNAGVSSTFSAEIRNEHIFAMTHDVAGRLLIAVSGTKGKIVRLAKEAEVVFEHERVQYIFAIARDASNNIYLGTGPEGLIFRLNPFCQNPEVLYEAKDKNILSLIVHEGMIYAGSDQRGLIYKIDPETRKASVLYESEQNEITSLWMDSSGALFAAASSAEAAILQLKASQTALDKSPGRPDSESSDAASGQSGSLNTDNTDKSEEKEEPKQMPQAPSPPAAKAAGHIYKIDAEGFVTDLFSQVAVFYTLLEFDGKLWLGTGNKGQLFTVDPVTEKATLLFEDKTSSQITSAVVADGDVYLGLSNPARLVQLRPNYETRGSFESPLLDAGQPARWGKLQIEADVPEDCQVWLASRSGNVNEPNDPTFSEWTPDVPLTKATDLDCPLGRYCQYRLTFKSDNASETPAIREVSAAYVIPNLAPQVMAVKVQGSRDKKKLNIYDINFAAKDENKDTLEYTIEFRKVGRSVWIPLKEELTANRFEWDGQTVEDGRYEVRVTANDRLSNSPHTALTGSRVSDPFVIDTTAPRVAASRIEIQGNAAVLYLSVVDDYSVIGKLRYTVNSNEKWSSMLPDDMVFDTRAEQFTLRVDDLDRGEYVIAVELSDDLENTDYTTFEVTIP